MGLVTSSFTPTSSGVSISGYGPTKSYVAHWYREPPGGDSEGAAYTSRVQITTDAAGARSISFTMSIRSGWSGQHSFDGKVYWAVSTSTSRPSSGSQAALSASSPAASGTISVNLLPNTTYYVHFWYSGYVHEYRGTLTFSTSGTYGTPGEITANNTTFDSPITMSYGSATSGGTYTVQVQVGSSSAVTLQTQSSTASRSWTPSLATYGSSYPNQASVNCTITVWTYFGSTLSGSKSKTVTISFTAAQVGPSTNNAFSIAPYNTSPISGMTGYIQNYSKIRATFNSSNVTRQYGASISKWTVKFGSASAVDVAAGTATKDSGTISATTSVTCTVVDSRGFTASETFTATITPYQQPEISADTFRCDGSGTPDDTGSYTSSTISVTYADIASQNTMQVQIFSKLASSSTYGSGVTVTGMTTTASGTNDIDTITGFLVSGYADAVYDVKFVATDALGNTAVTTIKIASQAWALHFRNGGAGAAIGKAAERDDELDIGDWKLTCGSIADNNGDSIIKMKTVTLTNFAIGSAGYTGIASYKPSGMNHFLFAAMWNYGNTTSKDAITVNANGEYVAATGGSTISSITIAYFYMD